MMIEVNLLPQELRRVEHTPLPRFLIIIAGTTVVSILLALGAIMHMRELPDLAKADAAISDEVLKATPSEREHDQLLVQMEEVKQRKRAIAEMWRARIIWSQKLDELSQMIPKFIGLDKLTLEDAKRYGGVNNNIGGFLSLSSVCAGADVDRLAMFRRILRGDYPVNEATDPWIGRTWYQDFASLDATPWVRKDMADYKEKEALNFTLKLAIKSDEQRLREYLERSRLDETSKSKSARTDVMPVPAAGSTPAAAVSEGPVTTGGNPSVVQTSGRVDK